MRWCVFFVFFFDEGSVHYSLFVPLSFLFSPGEDTVKGASIEAQGRRIL